MSVLPGSATPDFWKTHGQGLLGVHSLMDLLHPLLGRVLLIGPGHPTQGSLLSLCLQGICNSLVLRGGEHGYMSFYTGDSHCQLWTPCPKSSVYSYVYIYSSLWFCEVLLGNCDPGFHPNPLLKFTMQRNCIFFLNQELREDDGVDASHCCHKV